MRSLTALLLLLAGCGEDDITDVWYRFTVYNETGQTLESGDVCFDDLQEEQCLQLEFYLGDGEVDVAIWAPTVIPDGEPSLTAYVTASGEDGTAYLTDTSSFSGAAVDPDSDYVVPLLDAEITVTDADEF